MKEAHAAKMFPSWRIAIIWMARRYTIESMYVGQSVQHVPNSKEMIEKNRLCLFRKRSRHASLPNYGGGKSRFGRVATVC